MTPISIDQKHLLDIEFVRTLADHHRKYEEVIIDRIAADAGLKTEEEKEILWDFVYNDSYWMVNVTGQADQ